MEMRNKEEEAEKEAEEEVKKALEDSRRQEDFVIQGYSIQFIAWNVEESKLKCDSGCFSGFQ